MKPVSTKISRVARPRESARAAYNRLSRWYDVLAGSERRFSDAGLQMLAAREGERVLEIGFGTGHALVALARAVGPSGRVYGLDLSDGMLRASQARLEKAGMAGRVELALGDAASLPYESRGFDAAFMAFTLELFDTPDIPLVLSDCRRVLRDGGRLCVVSLSRRGRGLMLRLYEWAHQRWPTSIDCRPIHARESLHAAGFRITEAAAASMWGLPVEITLASKS